MTTTDTGSRTRQDSDRLPRRRGRGRRMLQAALTTVLVATAAVLGYGWYWEAQWHPVTDPAELAHTSCTIAADTLLTVTFSHGPGEVVSARFGPHRGGVMFGFSSEPVHRGARMAMATSTSVSTTDYRGLGDQSIFLADGTRLKCRTVALPRHR
jgi:hypothetical protein